MSAVPIINCEAKFTKCWILQVPMFINMDARVLKAICEHLKLVIYNEDTYIIREGEPLEKMFFITRGTA